jgi:hypothetical protein
MIRRTFSLNANRYDEEPPANPMEAVANISDVMLVLAVALMVAIIARWGVSVNDIVQIDESNMTPIEADISESVDTQSADGESEYEEVGKVYRNKDTDELYVVGS